MAANRILTGVCAAALLSAGLGRGLAAAQPGPESGAEARAARIVSAMSREEKLRLVFGYFGSPQAAKGYMPPKEARMGSAGYVPGIPQLGVPPQWQTDASLGVATQRDSTEPYRVRTSLPSSLATAATFDPQIAEQGGAMIGREALDSGFNVMLAGGVDLTRDPRNGRNFEYAGEDPLLAGTIAGAAVRGIQANHVISTIKHFALNDQEAGRFVASANLAEAPARQSDLLAFQFALEAGDPGSVMCAYNRVNGVYACENPDLLETALKHDWGFRGYVMSDWGATHSSAKAANAGLDQESGYPFDDRPYFREDLAQALAAGQVPPARLDDMARRIVGAMAANGLLDHPVREAPIDLVADAKVAQAAEEEAIVLLKNDGGLLPIARTARRIAVIGGHADRGVIAGGGSSTVFPPGGTAVAGLGPKSFPGPIVYHPSAPLPAIRARAGGAQVGFADGADPAAAAKLAAGADVAVVFVTQWAGESQDVAMRLDDDQDRLIAAVAAANPHTVVVLETGGPVRMPWLDQVGAVLEAWYPGSGGGEAIARVLFGEVDASGRLPVTFPRDESQLPRPHLDGEGLPADRPFDIDYNIEGAAVGYKWFDAKGLQPLFPFGYGLSYTRFDYGDLKVERAAGRLQASFTVRNVGSRAGRAVPQLYVSSPGWEAPKRLAGWASVELQPGESRRVSREIDPRLLAVWDPAAHGWKIPGGRVDVLLAASSRDIVAQAAVDAPAATLPASWRPPR